MALSFSSTTDLVNSGSAASLDNLANWSFMAWVYPTALTASRGIFTKQGGGSVDGPSVGFHWDGLGGLLCQVRRSSNDAWENQSVGKLVVNKWQCIATVYDETVSPRGIIYVGDLSTLLASKTISYSEDGSGSQVDSGYDMRVGNSSNGNETFPGHMARVMYFNATLSLDQLIQQQFRPFLRSDCVLWHEYGWQGTGTQIDYSGNANTGAVTGASVSAHVPLVNPFGRWTSDPYISSGMLFDRAFMTGGMREMRGGMRG